MQLNDCQLDFLTKLRSESSFWQTLLDGGLRLALF